MSWEARQNRLRGLVGSESTLCFYACVCVERTMLYPTLDEFNTAAIRLGAISEPLSNNGRFDADIPKKSFMEERNIPGYLYSNGGKHLASLLDAQLLYATPSYVLTNHDAYTSNAADDLRRIASLYTTNIEQEHPEFKFGNNLLAEVVGLSGTVRNVSLEFKFYVRPFNPQECHPRNFDVLKPITIIGDKPIQPSSQTIELS